MMSCIFVLILFIYLFICNAQQLLSMREVDGWPASSIIAQVGRAASYDLGALAMQANM